MTRRPLTAEHALLRLALFVRPSDRHRATAAGLAQRLRDPHLLLDAAVAHGLDLSLRDILRGAPLPATLRTGLDDRSRGVAVRSLVAEAQVAEVVQHLRRAGVESLVLKGPALATAYYGPAGRSYEDLDLLVRESDLEAAQRALTGAGYTLPQRIPASFEREFRRRYGERVFRGSRPLDVDLHWRLSQHLWPLAWTPEEMFARSRSLHVGSTDLRVPGPEDLLLYLASHGAKDGYRRWIWILDFARVLAAESPVDVAALAHRARRLGILRVLACALALSVPHLPSPPQPAAQRLALWGPAAALARSILSVPPERAGCYPPTPTGWGLHFRLRDRPRDRWQRPLGELLLPTPNEWALLEGIPFGRLMAPAVRPFRILARSRRRPQSLA